MKPWWLVLAVGLWTGAVGAEELERIATMAPKPEQKFQAVLWLQQHGEEMNRLLQQHDPQLAGLEGVWYHNEAETQIWRGRLLLPGKTKVKVYVMSVPMIPAGAAWKAGTDRRVVIGYRRKAATVNEPPGPLLSLDGPRQAGAKPVYAQTVRLIVDEEGHIYLTK